MSALERLFNKAFDVVLVLACGGIIALVILACGVWLGGA